MIAVKVVAPPLNPVLRALDPALPPFDPPFTTLDTTFAPFDTVLPALGPGGDTIVAVASPVAVRCAMAMSTVVVRPVAPVMAAMKTVGAAMMVAPMMTPVVAAMIMVVAPVMLMQAAMAEVTDEEANRAVAELDRTAHAAAAMAGLGFARHGWQQPERREGRD